MLEYQVNRLPEGQNGGRLDPLRASFPTRYVGILNDSTSALYLNIGVVLQNDPRSFYIPPYSQRKFPINTGQDFTLFFAGISNSPNNRYTIFFSDQEFTLDSGTFNPEGEIQAVTIQSGAVSLTGELPAGNEVIGQVGITNFPASFAVTGEVEVKNDSGSPIPVSVGNFPTLQAVVDSSASFKCYDQSVGTTAVTLASQACREVVILPDASNTGTVLLGSGADTPTFPIPNGLYMSVPVSNTNAIKLAASAAGQVVHILWRA